MTFDVSQLRQECVQFVELEVDIETGEVHVKRVLAYQSCGLPINRLTAESHIIGAVIQGVRSSP